MKFYYDLHIHSALSPCGSGDMTPNNIVNMSLIKGLDFIALSDHNATGNLEAAMECAKGTGLVVVPAMEIETAEEVHVLCLFSTLEGAKQASKEVYGHLMEIDNKPDIFGPQILYNHNDEVVGEERRLLISATSLPIEAVKQLAESCGGIAIPAHIDRNSYSVLSNLGFLPEIGFTTVEVSDKAKQTEYTGLGVRMITNSDAHYLEDIQERENWLELEEKSISALLNLLLTPLENDPGNKVK